MRRSCSANGRLDREVNGAVREGNSMAALLMEPSVFADGPCDTGGANGGAFGDLRLRGRASLSHGHRRSLSASGLVRLSQAW